jgi:hypothetical protein
LCGQFSLAWPALARVAAAGLLSALLALAGVGCGQAPNGFRADYNKAIAPVSEVRVAVAGSLRKAAQRSRAALSAELGDLTARFGQARRNLSRLDPPEGTGDEFDELLSALDTATTDLGALARAVKKGDRSAARKASDALSESGNEISDAEKRFQDAVADS